MRLVLLGLCALAAACDPAGGSAATGSALAFGPAQVVSHETANGATPMFVATAAGDRILAWVSAPDGGSAGQLHLSVTPAGAARPQPTITLIDPLGGIEAHGEAPPQLAAGSDGTIYAQYTVGKVVPGQRFPLSTLRVVRSSDLGRSWSTPVTVNDGNEFGAHNFHALTPVGGGELVSTWLDGRTGQSGVWLSRSRDGGRTWEPNRPIFSEPTCPCCRTSVAPGAEGALLVAWRAVLPGDVRDVVVMRSPDGGTTWETPVRPRADGWVFPGCPHAGPSLRTDLSGRVHVGWWTGKADEAGVYYAWSDDGGRSFTPQALAVGPHSAPAHVQVAVGPNGQVIVAWDDGLGRLPEVVLRYSRDGGVSFGPIQRLSTPGVAAGYPVVALVGDSVSVAWSQRGEDEHRALAAARPDMRDPTATMGLPRVGQSEVLMRTARLPGGAGAIEVATSPAVTPAVD